MSPLGKLLMAAKNNSLVGLWVQGQKRYPKIQDNWKENNDEPIFEKVQNTLKNYFDGKGLPQKYDFNISFEGTPFQQQVWKQIQKVKFGHTLSYKELANNINNPGAIRAVGSAVGRNPLTILIGCHRILNTNGGLGGFAGGIQKKKILLKLQNLM